MKKDFISGIKEVWGPEFARKVPNELLDESFDRYSKDYGSEFDNIMEASGYFNNYVNSPVYKQRYEAVGISPK